jgi:hypothetical protein
MLTLIAVAVAESDRTITNATDVLHHVTVAVPKGYLVVGFVIHDVDGVAIAVAETDRVGVAAATDDVHGVLPRHGG